MAEREVGVSTNQDSIYIGTAAWTIPAEMKVQFADTGTHLERYARRFNCVEINSSFYREHQLKTYEKWANSVPDGFRFSVKLSRYFTQEQQLTEVGQRLADVLGGISGLKEKWAILLVQLPPSLYFDRKTANAFMSELKTHIKGVQVVWEPRHPSWTSETAVELLAKYEMSKVLADPEPCRLSQSQRLKVEDPRYFRLHGAPQIYKSRYSKDVIERLAHSIEQPISPAQSTWCIFDNTSYGHATANALELKELLNLAPFFK